MSFLKKYTGTALGAVAAPFTGGLSLAGGYLYDVNKQQNEANKRAVDRANAYDMYTWDLANQYNNPKSQMQRLAAAGLNPNLVYGSGNVTGNTSGVASSNGVASQTAFDAIGKGLPLAQGLANLRNTNSQNELLQYQMGQTAAQTAQVKAQTLHTKAETENLNNFLTGNGRSTYDPVSSKVVDSGLGRLNSFVNHPKFVKAASGVGDFFSKHPFAAKALGAARRANPVFDLSARLLDYIGGL